MTARSSETENIRRLAAAAAAAAAAACILRMESSQHYRWSNSLFEKELISYGHNSHRASSKTVRHNDVMTHV